MFCDASLALQAQRDALALTCERPAILRIRDRPLPVHVRLVIPDPKAGKPKGSVGFAIAARKPTCSRCNSRHWA